jgi:hypothetical protein
LVLPRLVNLFLNWAIPFNYALCFRISHGNGNLALENSNVLPPISEDPAPAEVREATHEEEQVEAAAALPADPAPPEDDLLLQQDQIEEINLPTEGTTMPIILLSN